MSIRTAVVTGGNTGIGYQTCSSLAKQGYRVILACRDEAKGNAAVRSIKQTFPQSDVEMLKIDLADLDSVKTAAQTVKSQDKPIELLINNAGIMACPFGRTKDGFETQIGVNHLGHFLFTMLLLPSIKPAQESTSARIVNVASSAHQFGQIDLKDLNYNNKEYSAWPAYGQSKLANILFTNELVRRLPESRGIKAYSVHPGIVNTELSRYLIQDLPKFTYPILGAVGSLFFKTPAQGAATQLHVATSPDVESLNGKYFSDSSVAPTSDAAKDQETAEKLWDLSVQLTEVGDVDALLKGE